MLFNEPKLLKSGFHQAEKRRRRVSVLFNEPKLLKWCISPSLCPSRWCFSALQRAEIAEIRYVPGHQLAQEHVSVLFNEPKLLKSLLSQHRIEIKEKSFSALQRAEIAEMRGAYAQAQRFACFSALQRAEIAEIKNVALYIDVLCGFSALQRAEIAEIQTGTALLRFRDRFQCSSTSRNC